MYVGCTDHICIVFSIKNTIKHYYIETVIDEIKWNKECTKIMRCKGHPLTNIFKQLMTWRDQV